MLDWNGLLNRIGNLAVDIKQTQERNKLVGFAVLGISAILILILVIFSRRK